LALSVTYLILSNGVYLKELSFPSLHINKLYIKWDKKLNISINDMTIMANKNSLPMDFKPKDIRKHLKNFGLLASFIQSIVIEKINYRDIYATVRYVDTQGGYIRASSKSFNIDTIIHRTKKHINFEIINLTDTIKQISIHGNIVLDLTNRELLLRLNTAIAKEINLNIFTFINASLLQYAITSNKDITNYSHLINILNIHPKLKYWVYEAIKMDKAVLKKAYGFIDFLKPDEAFNNLYISADIAKLEYSYHKKLDSIHTQSTNLEFKQGTLNIRPKNHTTYDFHLDKSWLNINFNTKEPQLSLHLLFNGFVDKNLLHILNTFGIKLPFKQNSGTLATDLTLKINLLNLNVDAQGDFFTNKANFTYLGLNLNIFNTHITLDNYKVTIDKMFAKYKKNISANVTANLDTKNNEGIISFDVDKANFNENMLWLDTDKQLHIDYKISSTGDIIKVSESQWNLFKEEKITVESIDIPFNYENLFATIPTTQIKIGNAATIYASGSTSFKTFSTNLELDVTKFKYGIIELAQSNLLLDVSFVDSKFMVSANENVRFILSNQDCSILNPKISLHQNKIITKSSEFVIENLLEAKVALAYALDNSNGFLNIEKMNFKNDMLGSIFKNTDFIGFKLKKENNKFTAFCPDMSVLIALSQNKWNVAFKSLAQLHKHSKLLQKYNLNNGKVTIFKSEDEKDIKFHADINHQKKFININNKLISHYKIDGYINSNTGDINLNINDKIHTTWGKQISITGQDIGINLGSIIDYLASIKDDQKDSKSKNINLELLNSFVYFSKDRRAIADKINLQYYDNIATAQLIHQGATAGFKLQDNNFFLYGEDFNDIFMDNLFALSRFKGGSFDFSIKGSLEEYVGILYVKDTTVIEYKLLNNILAFINTIPSLVTFSLPGYNKNGLSIQNSYINFSFANDQYTLKDISLESKEMDIYGNGKASYKENTIDLNLNLKTDLASAISKIPVVGYIIFNEDSISTSLKVSGKLSDPEVETMLAKDIIIAPLNIIKRTLLFPFKLFE